MVVSDHGRVQIIDLSQFVNLTLRTTVRESAADGDERATRPMFHYRRQNNIMRNEDIVGGIGMQKVQKIQ